MRLSQCKLKQKKFLLQTKYSPLNMVPLVNSTQNREFLRLGGLFVVEFCLRCNFLDNFHSAQIVSFKDPNKFAVSSTEVVIDVWIQTQIGQVFQKPTFLTCKDVFAVIFLKNVRQHVGAWLERSVMNKFNVLVVEELWILLREGFTRNVYDYV